MVGSFLFCFTLRTSYEFAGIVYSFITFSEFIKFLTPDSSTSDKLFNASNVIVFGAPALFWALDKIWPSDKYKKIFHSLYLWLTQLWILVYGPLLGLAILALSVVMGGEIDLNDVLLLLGWTLLLFVCFSLPTLYIAKCIESYIESTETKAPVADSDTLIIIML